MEEVNSIGLEEFIRKVQPKEIYNDAVIVMEMKGSDQENIPPDIFPLRFEAHSVFLVCQGEMSITIDYVPYILQQNMIIEHAQIHLMNDIRMSHNFKGYHLILGEQIIQNLVKDIVTVVPKEYAFKKRFNPVQKLDNKDFQRLITIIERIRENIARKEHIFQKGIIFNEAYNFIMELFNIEMQNTKGERYTLEMNHHEELAIRFVKLLVTNCRKWNEVASYSTELCVTPIYLSRTVKLLSGKSALEWINNARLTEAKILLRKRGYTIQDIADILHFSDQSAFGKFFKKQTGISPVEYKRTIAQQES